MSGDVLIRQVQGALRGRVAAEVATPAAASGATFSVVVPHGLGVTPAGAVFSINPGGGLVTGLVPECVTAIDDTNVTCLLRNDAGFALAASTIVIAVHAWLALT